MARRALAPSVRSVVDEARKSVRLRPLRGGHSVSGLKRPVIALIAVVACGALILTLAASGNRAAHLKVPRLTRVAEPAPPAIEVPTTADTANASGTFSVLSHAATPRDSLPATSPYVGGAARLVGPASGAGQASTSAPSAWLVVTHEQVCITLASGAAACNSLAELQKPNQLLSVSSTATRPGSQPSPTVIAGIAPTGVDSVTIHFQDGSAAVAPVTNDGFVYTTSRSQSVPTGYTWSANGVPSAE
jgi:hypothetical protein